MEATMLNEFKILPQTSVSVKIWGSGRRTSRFVNSYSF